MTIAEMYQATADYKPHRNPIDLDVVAQTTCLKDHQMEYRGFKKGASYRAFAICKVCNVAQEF